MKIGYILLFCLGTFLGIAQENFEVYYKEIDMGYQIFAKNGEYSPVSVEINFNIENLHSSIGAKKIIEVPATTEAHFIAELTIEDIHKSFAMGYTIRYNHGNHLQTLYDEEYAYYLPYQKGTSHRVSQGYNGSISHKDEYALDFSMPVGTPIYAAREGVIVLVEEQFKKTCTTADCAKFNNYILVYHPDGTFAEYTHIQHKGALVAPGDRIEVGQHIGYSGNVGWSTGPHLHFIVFLQRFQERETLPTKFKVASGTTTTLLEEGMSYKREY